MRTQEVFFENGRGQRLAAKIDMPVAGKPVASALFAHCFTCSKDLKSVRNISHALAAERIAVFRFDFTGLGKSEGEFGETGVASNAEDLMAAAEYMKEAVGSPQILIGHSFGGVAVLHAASRIPSVKGVVTIGSPYDPEHIKHLLGEGVERIEEEGRARVSIGGRPFEITSEFLDQLEETNVLRTIEELGAALLVMHAPLDNTVGIENAARIFTAAKHPKSFISLDTADHLLTDERDATYAGNLIAAWARHYISVPEEISRIDLDPADNRIASRTESGSFVTDVVANGHTIVVDEPPAVGGSNLGPTPYDLLVAAIGSCTSMTLTMYADRKKWPLESVTVRLRHDKVHEKDCENSESEGAKIDVIEREIELEGDLTDEQKDRLLEIANKCPVHRTLEGKMRVETRLRESEK